jgi:hypothetical protein
MISVSRSKVPKYLRSSEFFLALDDDEEEDVAIPKNCCAESTEVNSPEDLTLLLSTLRFWGVSEIPSSLVHYVVWHKPADVIHAFAEFENELRYVSFLEALCKGTANAQTDRKKDYLGRYRSRPQSDCTMKCAAEICVLQYEYEDGQTWDSMTCKLAAQYGRLDVLRFLHEHGCPWDKSCCKQAAEVRNLPCLQYAHENGCPWGNATATAAAGADCLPCLQYAHEHGCELDDEVFAASRPDSACRKYLTMHKCPRGKKACAEAARRGDVALLRSLHESGCEWDSNTCHNAALYDQLSALTYAHENGCPWDEETCAWAAMAPSLPCLQYAHEHGCPWDETLMNFARKPAIFRYAVTNRCPGSDRACEIAAGAGSLELLEFARKEGCLLTKSVCEGAAKAGSLPCLTYAREQKCPWDAQTCRKAAESGSLNCLKYAHESGCPWNEYTCASAAAAGKLDCLLYLHEHGCPWSEFACTEAARVGALDCLRYAHEHGCPWTSTAVTMAARDGKLSCLQYLMENACPLPLQCNYWEIELTSHNRKCIEYLAEHPHFKPIGRMVSQSFYPYGVTYNAGFHRYDHISMHGVAGGPQSLAVHLPSASKLPDSTYWQTLGMHRYDHIAMHGEVGKPITRPPGNSGEWTVVGKRGRAVRSQPAIPPKQTLAEPSALPARQRTAAQPAPVAAALSSSVLGSGQLQRASTASGPTSSTNASLLAESIAALVELSRPQPVLWRPASSAATPSAQESSESPARQSSAATSTADKEGEWTLVARSKKGAAQKGALNKASSPLKHRGGGSQRRGNGRASSSVKTAFVC